MIILLSPAKSLDFKSELPSSVSDTEFSSALFAPETDKLVHALSKFSKSRLKKIMPVSDALIDLNRERYSQFFNQPARPALFAFNGDVYTGIEAKTLDPAAINFAQDHLRIISGLYGLLRPLDTIRPYRLEMGTKWAPGKKSLVAFWDDHISAKISADLTAVEGDTVLNLASREYFAAADKGLADRSIRVISPDFRQAGPDGPRFISFAAKKARGMAARYMCENRFTDIEALKGFDWDGYGFDPNESTEASWRFVRS